MSSTGNWKVSKKVPPFMNQCKEWDIFSLCWQGICPYCLHKVSHMGHLWPCLVLSTSRLHFNTLHSQLAPLICHSCYFLSGLRFLSFSMLYLVRKISQYSCRTFTPRPRRMRLPSLELNLCRSSWHKHTASRGIIERYAEALECHCTFLLSDISL